MADAYRAAAHILGLAPHATQAIAWAAWRNRYGRFAFQRVNTEDEAPGADPGAPSGDDTEPRTDPATYPDDTEPRTDPATYPDRREEP
ncbi:MAG: hypothetical protein GWN07_41145 [Actinobacteria bacterium]|nr:hypothetical protein [Actinomycetota bacterium]NIS37420.1 hypothetical protein [Actinomycetota bacterium]NIU71847.1 hypothetical protein [Actinomycetota bacterium]NIW33793.1 hypothetical protein [Actinomycetota bacterium]NIX25882.1 hypothetical protein [Actinomycetota bacterium]